MTTAVVAHRRGRWRRKWSYWHYGAAVYPDGRLEWWHVNHETGGYISIPPVDDDLNRRDDPWDGHTQGHCGEHISIFGTDRFAVARAFKYHLRVAVARQDGVCHSRFSWHEGAVDGSSVYQVGFFGMVRRRGESEPTKLPCMNHWEHDWGEWSEWWSVGAGQFNRQRICNRCIQINLMWSAATAHA